MKQYVQYKAIFDNGVVIEWMFPQINRKVYKIFLDECLQENTHGTLIQYDENGEQYFTIDR